MIRTYIKGKAAIFIDAANVFYAERTLGWRIDYQRLVAYLHKEASVTELHYYTGVVEKNARQSAFLDKLKSFGFAVTAKEVKIIRSAGEPFISKGNLDVELALDAYMRCGRYDTFVLFSGDSDFAYLLDVLKKEGKNVIVISTRGHISRELIARAKYIALPKLKEVIGGQKFKRPDKPASEV